MEKTIKKIKLFFASVLLRIKKKPQPINDYSQPYIIEVENNSNEWQEYELFGASRNLLKVKDGVFDFNGVTIKNSIINTDYNDLLVESMLNPSAIGITYVVCDNIDKCSNIILTTVDAKGNYRQIVMPLIADPYQNQIGVILLREKYNLDVFTKLNGKIPANTKMVFYLYPLK